MKKQLLISAAVILVVGASLTVCAREYNRQHQKTVAAAQAKEAAEKAKDAKIKSLEADNKFLTDTANTNRVNCEKGQASYDLLTPFNKTKIARPTCSAVIVR